MTIRVRCPHCDDVLAFADSREGQVEECENCTGGLRVPRLLRYTCGDCHHRFMSAPHHAGRTFPCLKCGADVVVPEHLPVGTGVDHPDEPPPGDWGEDDAGASMTSDDWFDDKEPASVRGRSHGSFPDDSDASVSDHELAPQFGAAAIGTPAFGTPELQAAHSESHEPASFLARVGAYLIDTLLFCAFGGVVGGVFGAVNAGLMTSDPEAFAEQLTGMSLVLQFVILLVSLMYGTIMEASPLQGTLGKLALGLRVEDEHGSPLGIGRSLGRNIGKAISATFCALIFFVALLTAHKQTLHDMIAGTYVVRKS